MCPAWDHAALVIGAIPIIDSLNTLGSRSSCMAVERQNYLQRIEAVCSRCPFSHVCFRLDFYLNRLKFDFCEIASKVELLTGAVS